MKSILNLTYPATFKFSFTKAEIKDGKALAMYEKDYENYFNSLKKGDEVLSLKEYIECMGGFTEGKEEKS